MKRNIYKTVLTDGEYYFENRSVSCAIVTKDPSKAWDFNHWLYDIRTDYNNYLKFDLEQFVLVCKQEIIGDKGVKQNIDYLKSADIFSSV